MLRAVFDSIDDITIIVLLRPGMSARSARKVNCAAIAEVYNHAMLHTAAIWNDQTVGADNRIAWFEARTIAGYPVLVSEEDSVMTGYTSFGDWRSFDGFRYTTEHSAYVHPGHQGKGLGHKLLSRLIDRARDCGEHVTVVGVESQNQASLHLHQSLGFVITAWMPQIGTKFGHWLDLILMQLRLDKRAEPDTIGQISHLPLPL